MSQQTCEVEFQLIGGFGETEICGKPAVFICKSDKDGSYPVCDECSYNIHPKRLRYINENPFADSVV